MARRILKGSSSRNQSSLLEENGLARSRVAHLPLLRQRDLPFHEDEDVPILLPNLDNSALVARYHLTLIGRTFNTSGRSTEALLAFMPKEGIWNLEGRVQGRDLGNGRFCFDFQSEEDLQRVLRRRPCHFNKWTFALERWTPNLSEDFPDSVTFWIKITGVPLHYWMEDAFREIGRSLGHVEEVDENGGRVRVLVNVTRPLVMRRRAQFQNGDSFSVSLQYEKLYRFCFLCHSIAHEERACPRMVIRETNEGLQRRNASSPRERLRVREDSRPSSFHRTEDRNAPRNLSPVHENVSSVRATDGNNFTRNSHQSSDLPRRQVRRRILRDEERSVGLVPRSSGGASVWQRIDGAHRPPAPRSRVASEISSSGSRKRRTDEESNSPFTFRLNRFEYMNSSV